MNRRGKSTRTEDELGVGGGGGRGGGGGGGGSSAEFLSQTVLDAVDGVLETTVAMQVWGGMPRVVAFTARGRVAASSVRREKERD